MSDVVPKQSEEQLVGSAVVATGATDSVEPCSAGVLKDTDEAEQWPSEALGKHSIVKARIGWRGLASSEYTEEGPFLVAGKHVRDGLIDWPYCDHITERRYRESMEIALEPGDVILTKDGTIGRVARIDHLPGVATINGTMMLVRAGRALDYRYLFHTLQGARFKRLIDDRVSGSSIPHIFQRDMVTLPIALPPVGQQRGIADVLDNLDTTIRQTEAIIAKLKQVKQGLLHDLLTRGIDANGELRPPQSQAPHLYKQSPLGWIPKEWQALALAEVAASIPNAIVDGPFGSNLKSEHYRLSGVPVIQSGYVTSGDFFAESYVYVTQQHFQAQARSRVDPGDIVVAKIGANAGMCAVLPQDHAFGILAGNCMKITVDDHIVRRDWLVFYLHRLYQITGMSEVRTETAQPAISLGRIRRMMVPVPPLCEQERAIHSLASMEQSVQLELTAAIKSRALKSGLMDDLLTGRVRITPLLTART